MSFMYRKKTKNCKHDWRTTDPLYKSIGYVYYNCSKCGKPRKSKSQDYDSIITKYENEIELAREMRLG